MSEYPQFLAEERFEIMTLCQEKINELQVTTRVEQREEDKKLLNQRIKRLTNIMKKIIE